MAAHPGLITQDKTKTQNIEGSCWFGVGFFPPKGSLPVEDYFYSSNSSSPPQSPYF